MRLTMMWPVLTGLLIADFSLCNGAEPPSAEKQVRYARPDLLLEPAELARPKTAERFVILDARPREEYAHAHVPGASHVDHDSWKKAFKEGEGKDVDAWSNRIGALGIGSPSKVVVYDDKGMKDAARIWWILKYFGVEDVRLLNGGWKGWLAEDLPTTKAIPEAASPTGFKAIPRPQRLATMDQVLDLLRADAVQIVDARSDAEFCGIDDRDNKRKGAIPGAKHLEWSDLIDQKTGRFKNASQLQHLFREANIELSRPTATHCNGGGRAAVMAFGLELMGAEKVRNYYRGWGEWGNAEDTPVVVPKRAE